MLDSVFTNCSGKLKKFIRVYYAVSTGLLVFGGVIGFIACVSSEYTAPFAFAILLGVPVVILVNAAFCWAVHAFASIARHYEKEEQAEEGNVVLPVEPMRPAPTYTLREDSIANNKKEDDAFFWRAVIIIGVIAVLCLLLTFLLQ